MTITACRACGSSNFYEVIDLGDQYLSDFRPDDTRPPKHPLRLWLCLNCALPQLSDTAPPAQLYHDRYSFKSGVNPAISADLADVVQYALAAKPDARRWLDIASNDGTLLRHVPDGIYRTGIDPLAQFAHEAGRHADRIVCDLFDPAHFPGEQFDVITAVSMFYDLDNPVDFCRGAASMLAPDGVWVIQQNYLLTMLQAGSVDNISHEHLAYYSMRTLDDVLNQAGLEIVDVQLNPINGGCFRTLVAHMDARPITDAVIRQEIIEVDAGLGDVDTYRAFADRARYTLARLAELVHDINARSERVYVYGASTRGGTLWQAAGLDVTALPFVVDRNPAKVGAYMSAIGAPIISEDQARADRPEYMLVGPWWFRDQFVERERDYLAAGGKLIIPLPELEVISA